jgi:DNA-directed RNA polymerase specialized sigma24 family protein
MINLPLHQQKAVIELRLKGYKSKIICTLLGTPIEEVKKYNKRDRHWMIKRLSNIERELEEGVA